LSNGTGARAHDDREVVEAPGEYVESRIEIRVPVGLHRRLERIEHDDERTLRCLPRELLIDHARDRPLVRRYVRAIEVDPGKADRLRVPQNEVREQRGLADASRATHHHRGAIAIGEPFG
jgi:hypothetical protein